MTESMLEMCESTKSCLRCGIMALNSVLLLVGAGSVAVGIWLLTAEDSYFYRYHDVITDSDMNHELLKDGVIALLSGGVAVLVFAALGMVATYTMHSCLLGLYCVLLAALMVVEVVPVILAVVFKADWVSKLDEQVLSSLHNKYGGHVSVTSKDFTAALDTLQADFECCGWHNGTDYVSESVSPKRWSAQTDDGVPMVVPFSCCEGTTTNDTLRQACVTDPATSHIYFKIGCRDALIDILNVHQILVIILGAVTLGMEMVMIVATILLLTCTVNNKYNLD
ncbi:CD151 antigen-like [Babylonia areolata]|uniref:CD151 antigen-like n=1 Tax=Babylonia areolata TaxID=304850 RepID=UPI003FD4B7B4